MQPSHRILSAIAIGISVAGYANAAPTVSQVSGTVGDNNSVTISGTGFGTKSVASPLVYDNFEGGTVGAKVLTSNATVGQWQTGAGYDNVYYTADQVHAGSKAAKLPASAATGVYNMSLSQNGSFSTVYMDWWVRVDYFDQISRNYKPWRLYGANDTLQANSVIMCNASGMSVEYSGGNSFWWDPTDYTKGKWQHYQVILKESSSAGAADGTFKQYIDGVLKSSHTGVVTRTSSSHWDQIRIGHFWATDGVDDCPGNSGANIYVDSVYVDTTWARVELGNSPTYATSTVREIQIPKTWSDSSVSVSVNRGAFAAGATAYLYVTDANGNVNATGYPVTIGSGTSGGGGATAPAAPTSLTVH